MILLLTLLLSTFNARAHLQLERIDSPADLAEVRRNVLILRDDPHRLSSELLEWFRDLPDVGWTLRFVNQLRLLDVLAWYADLERTRARGHAAPPHALARAHVTFYDQALHPNSLRARGPVLDVQLHVFARLFLRGLLHTPGPKPARLMQILLGTGREYWLDQIIANVIEPQNGVRLIAERLDQLLPFVPPAAFRRVALAISHHHPDRRDGAQNLMDSLWAYQVLAGEPAGGVETGDRVCDHLLKTARAASALSDEAHQPDDLEY